VVVDDSEGAEGRLDGSEGFGDDPGPYPLSRMRRVALRCQLFEANPGNDLSRSRLMYTLGRVGEMNLHLGRHPRAEEATREALEHARRLRTDVQDKRHTHGYLHLLLAELARAAGRDPCPAYRAAAAAGDTLRVPNKIPAAEEIRRRARERMGACGVALP
jgi:hypothetical protein